LKSQGKPSIADRWQALLAVAGGFGAVGGALLPTNFKLAGLILLGLAVSILFAIPFSVFTTPRAAVTVFMTACVVCAIGIFQFERPSNSGEAQANYCNPIESSTGAAYVDSEPASQGLQVVKILANEETGQTPCVKVDVSLLNNSGKEVFVTRAAFQIVHSWRIFHTCQSGGKGGGSVPLIANYNTTISLHEVPNTSYLDQVSQYLAAQDTDRFTITARLTNDPSNSDDGFLILEGRVKIFYNSRMETPWSEPFLFLSKPILPQGLRYSFGEPQASAGLNGFIGPRINLSYENKVAAENANSLAIAQTSLARQTDQFLLASKVPSCLYVALSASVTAPKHDY
jgi:hypothetical protein